MKMLRFTKGDKIKLISKQEVTILNWNGLDGRAKNRMGEIISINLENILYKI